MLGSSQFIKICLHLRERLNVSDDKEPLKTVGDGNCLYRALSRALKNDEKYWPLLKLAIFTKAVIEEDAIVEKVKIIQIHAL